MTKLSKSEIRKDLERVKSLDAIQHTQGGKLLVQSILKDVISTIETLMYGYTTLSHIEMIAHSAKLKERYELYKTLINAKKNRKIAEADLKLALEEDPDF